MGDIGEPRRYIECEPMPASEPAREPATAPAAPAPEREKQPA